MTLQKKKENDAKRKKYAELHKWSALGVYEMDFWSENLRTKKSLEAEVSHAKVEYISESY